MVAPLLKGSKAYPFVVSVEATAENGLDETREIHLEQMRVVDDPRIVDLRSTVGTRKLGTLENKYWSEIEKSVCIVLGFNAVFDP